MRYLRREEVYKLPWGKEFIEEFYRQEEARGVNSQYFNKWAAADNNISKPSDALYNMITWHDTEGGYDYWLRIYEAQRIAEEQGQDTLAKIIEDM
jgi:hypothetical protein